MLLLMTTKYEELPKGKWLCVLVSQRLLGPRRRPACLPPGQPLLMSEIYVPS